MSGTNDCPDRECEQREGEQGPQAAQALLAARAAQPGSALTAAGCSAAACVRRWTAHRIVPPLSSAHVHTATVHAATNGTRGTERHTRQRTVEHAHDGGSTG